MRATLFIVAAALGGAVQAAERPAPDLTVFPTRAEAESMAPKPCGTTPSADTLMGSSGSANCYQRGDAARPTVVQAANTTTNAAGVWLVTWSKPFAGASPYLQAQPINAADPQPFVCNVTSSTTTTATGRCWKTVQMTLPTIATALLGLVLNPTASTGAIPVRVVGRDVTQ